jgi:CheY-like chemotaxis protein
MSAAAADRAHTAMGMLHQAAERSQPFQLVLTDAAMPDVDGFSLAEQIASAYRAAMPKMILLTSAAHRRCAVVERSCSRRRSSSRSSSRICSTRS